MSKPLYYVDGTLSPPEEATVSVSDRGFKYGDAAFETLRAYGSTPFAWERHLDRLSNTCELLGMDHGYQDAELFDAVTETLAANGYEDAYVRLSITRGPHSGKLNPPADPSYTLVIIVSELSRGGRSGSPVWDGPAELSVVDTERIPDTALPAAAKTHNYLNGILARKDTDADETIMLDRAGNVTEGATSNVFVSNDGTLATPSLDGPVLPGITREVVLELAATRDIPVDVGVVTPADLRNADELFVTNSTWEIRPVSRVDDTEIGTGPVTKRLIDAYDERVEARHY